MKKWMIALLALSFLLTACGREGESEGAAEPVMEETAEAIQTEPVTVETPEPVPAGQPERASWSFPDTIEEVVMQENQFSPVANGRYDRVEPDSDCWNALELVMDGWDESEGALYFESRSLSTWHQRNLKYLFKHGNHYFYKEKEVSHEKKVSD